MTKALIILPSTSRYSPAKVGNFLWNEEYQAHIYDGRPIAIEEFNRISKRIFFEHRDEIEDYDLPPYVQLIDVATVREDVAPEQEQDLPELPAKRIFKRRSDLIAIPELK